LEVLRLLYKDAFLFLDNFILLGNIVISFE